MTDSQAFELRLADAFERYLDDAPTSVESTAMAASIVETAPRSVRRAFPWPATPYGRALAIALVALIVLTLLALGAGALQRDRSKLAVSEPTQAPIANATLPAPMALPDVLRGATWLASGGVVPGIGQTDPQIRLGTSADGMSLWVEANALGAHEFASQSVSANPGEIGLVATSAVNGCLRGDSGRYAVTQSADGGGFELRGVSDTCLDRRAALEREWTRDLGLANIGGRGVIAFDSGPVLGLTLPAGSWQAGRSSGSGYVVVTEQGVQRGLIAVHDPVPASGQCGSAPDGPETIAEFVAHLRTVPGFTVRTTPETIAGDPAARVTITNGKNGQCPVGGLPAGTLAEYSGGGNTAFLLPGTTETWNLVQVAHPCGATTCSDLYLLGYLGLTTADEQQVFASITFKDALPTVAP